MGKRRQASTGARAPQEEYCYLRVQWPIGGRSFREATLRVDLPGTRVLQLLQRLFRNHVRPNKRGASEADNFNQQEGGK